MSQKEVFIVSMARTPFASFQGALSGWTAAKLGAEAIRATLAKVGLKGEQVSEVIMGNVLQGGQGQAPGRQAMIYAGVPSGVPAVTVNKVCGSGMKAVMLGAQSILLGDSDVVVAGGMESMSNAPYFLPTARKGMRMGEQKVVDGMIHDGLWDPYNDQHMGNCGELCAREWKFTREQQDAFAIESFKRAIDAQKSGKFRNEIAPVSWKTPKGEPITVENDEGPSRAKFDKIPQLKPAFDKAGTVTAANASSIDDGAAALVLMSGEKMKALGLKPIAKIASYGQFAQDPQWFTTAPAGAAKRALDKAGWKLDQVDLFEVNEAFAVVPLAFMKELSVPREKVNVWGGAIALGHPIGASGARLLITLASALKDKGLKRGLASICIGGGEATAVALELV